MGYKGIGLPFAGTVYGDLRYNKGTIKLKFLSTESGVLMNCLHSKAFLIDCLYKMKVCSIKENQERIKDNINPGNLRNCYL